MTSIEGIQEIEKRVKRAALLVDKQRKEIAQLQQSLELVQMHNEELQKYADSYKEDAKLIEDSIARSLETLDSIDGLDDLTDDFGLNDFDVAEDFSGGEAVTLDDSDLGDIL